MAWISLRLLRVHNLSRALPPTVRLVRAYTTQVLEHVTLRKLANALVAKVQKRLRRDTMWAMPYRYFIDPLNVCNLKCPLCPTGLGTLERKRGKMRLEDYKKIIDQIAPYAFTVQLYNWGEPFLHPQIFDMIRYASDRRIAVRLSSNLNHFDEDMAEKVVASGLDSLTVDVDGATEESYQKYRVNGELKQVLAHLDLLVAAKRRHRSRKPFILFRSLVNRYNESEIEELRRIAADRGADSFMTGPIFVNTNSEEQKKEWLPRDEQLSYYNYSKPLTNVWHCSDLWESLTINWDGGMAPCCWLHDKKHDFENVFDRPIREIWNGEAYVSSRRVFARGGSKSGPTETICTTCKGQPQYLEW